MLEFWVIFRQMRTLNGTGITKLTITRKEKKNERMSKEIKMGRKGTNRDEKQKERKKGTTWFTVQSTTRHFLMVNR